MILELSGNRANSLFGSVPLWSRGLFSLKVHHIPPPGEISIFSLPKFKVKGSPDRNKSSPGNRKGIIKEAGDTKVERNVWPVGFFKKKQRKKEKS